MTQTDSFGHHEVLHLTHVFGCMWSDHILAHTTVAADPALRDQAEKIAEAIGAFYVAVGTKS